MVSEGVEEEAESLAHRRMRDARVAHLLVAEAAEHRHLHGRDHLARLVSQQGDAEDEAR